MTYAPEKLSLTRKDGERLRSFGRKIIREIQGSKEMGDEKFRGCKIVKYKIF